MIGHIALAALAYAALLAAVVETFARGSVVRWWTVAIVAVYAGVTAVCRRRMSWRARSIASGLTLTGMLAITAWLPGGLENGVRLVGLSTSALLTLAAAAGVTIGILVVCGATRIPLGVRAVVALVGAYAVIAFLSGLAAGVPLSALLSGESFWRRLPVLLQGAVVGALFVLPAGLAITAVRLGTRHPRPGSAERALYQAVALATTLAVVVAALPQRSNGESAQAASTAGGDDTARRLAILDNSLRAIEDGDRESPRDRWDPAYIVERVGKDPQALSAWVRDNTFWIPYRGLLRGPVGVLMDRQGNSLDRALLFARLLETAGHTVRVAHGEISRQQALDLLPGLVARHSASFTTPREADVEPPPDVAEVAAQYRLDGAAIERERTVQQDAVSRLVQELQTRAADQAGRLLSAVAQPDEIAEWLTRYEGALVALQDHWWVQRESDGVWSDLDVLAPAGPLSMSVPAQGTMAAAEAPPELRHELALRVIVERWSNGALEEARVLEHVLQPSEVYGQPVVLQFWPASWPRELVPDPHARFGLKAVALEQREWTAALLIGGHAAAQTVIRGSADSVAVRAPEGNPFGGVGGAMAQLPRATERSNGPAQELTAAWIEYEMRAPGGSHRSVRRAVFDLLGRAARAGGRVPELTLTDDQRIARSLALMMRTEIVAVPCDLAPEFVSHLAAQSLVGNRDIFRAIARDEIAPGEAATEELLANAAPGVTPLYALVLARTQWSRVSDRLHTDRVGIFTRHRYPAFAGQALVLRDAVDIVANEMGVTLAAPDAFAVRLEQGVFDTNAEALLYSNAVSVGNTGEAFKASRSWVAFTPAQSEAVRKLDLPADAQRAIGEDLGEGYAVVAPQTAVPIGAQRYIGWWRINPATGDALGVAASGWGQAMTERGVQYNALVEMVKTFAFEYAFCQAVPQVANLTVAFLQPYRNELPAWLPPLAQTQDPRALYNANRRGCLIGAMIGTGVTATLPMLLIFLRGYAARLASRLGPLVRDQRGGVRIPPGWVRGPIRGTPAPGGTPPAPNPSGGSQTVNPLARTGVDPFAGTQPGAAPAAPGSATGGQPVAGAAGGQPRNWLQPFRPGKAPAGEGPFQGDPELRDWLQNNPDHPLTQMLGGRAAYGEGGTPALYHQADAAARSAYNGARGAGQSAEAARQASYEQYWEYLKQGRGDYAVPQPSGGVQFKKAPGTMKMEAGGTGLGGSGKP